MFMAIGDGLRQSPHGTGADEHNQPLHHAGLFVWPATDIVLLEVMLYTTAVTTRSSHDRVLSSVLLNLSPQYIPPLAPVYLVLSTTHALRGCRSV